MNLTLTFWNWLDIVNVVIYRTLLKALSDTYIAFKITVLFEFHEALIL